MKTLVSLISFFLLFSGFAWSQNQQMPGGSMKRDSSQMKNMPKNGLIFGKLHDASNNRAVEYATVAVLTVRDSSIVGGGLTDGKGNFRIEQLPMGQFKIRITFIGYETYYSQPIKVFPGSNEVDLGLIKIKENSKVLKQAEVTSEKSEVMQSIDRKVYNVEKNIVNTGGTVVDVLQQIPSVTTDLDGKVQLRGSDNVTILIDGKPSSLLGANKNDALKQIPANAIQQIEVITNPSAKYDAEGMAGIINIVTKKDKMKGVNGNVSVGAGTGDKYNAAIGLNNRTAKTNVFMNYSFRKENRWGEGAGTQYYYLPNVDPYSFQNENNSFNKSMFNMVKAGVDYYLDNYNTIGLTGTYSSRKEDKSDVTTTTFYNDSDVVTSGFDRSAKSDENNQTAEGSLDYKHLFPNSKRELTANMFYSYNGRSSVNDYYQTTMAPENVPYQKNTVDGPQINATAQTDYVHPFSDKAKIEAGVKGAYRKMETITVATVYEDSAYVNDIRYSDDYNYNDEVIAAYAMYSRKLNSKFDLNAGLRTEGTWTEGLSNASDSAFTNNYINLFPSAFLKYNIKQGNDLQLSYSRRINRPNMWSLNPFTDYSDSMNLRTGNPYLKPELIHSLDLSYSKTGNVLGINTSVYYRHTDDLISRFRDIDTITGVATMRPINYSTSDNLGLDLTLRYQIGKLGNIMLSASTYYNKINGENIDASLQSEAFNWNSRLAVNLKVMKNTTVQLTGFYAGPMKGPNSTVKGMMNGVDIGIKQDMMKGKASLSLNVNDVFNIRKFQIHNYGDYYDYNGYRKRESRIATLTFAYRFGSQDSNLFKSKKNQRNDMQQDMPQMDF